MLRGDWRLRAAFGLAILLAAATGGILYGEASLSQRVYEHEADQKAKAYRAAAGIHAQRRCSFVPRPEIRECVYEEYHAARQREREEYDLQAQLVMSVWTRAMGIAAIIGMIFGIFGVGLVFITFRGTRQANVIAGEAFESQLRPWIHFKVSINGSLAVVNDHLELWAPVTFENIGSSPAIDLTYMATMIFGPSVDPVFRELVDHFRANDSDWADKNLFPHEQWQRKCVAVHTGERQGIDQITYVLIARYRTSFSDNYRFTARAFDVGPTVQNVYGEIVPEGHRLIDLSAVTTTDSIVRIIEKQHFSGLTT